MNWGTKSPSRTEDSPVQSNTTAAHDRLAGAVALASEPAKPKRDYVADHARRTLRKAGLTKEQAALAVANVHGPDRVPKLSSLSRSVPCGLREWLYGAFVWGETPQGLKYWDDIAEGLANA